MENDKNIMETINSSKTGVSHSVLLNQDWIIAVEGSTDKLFYEKFCSYLNIETSNGIKNKYPENHTRISCRDMILKTIKSQSLQPNKHWFGIMDADYSLPVIPSEIKIGKEIIFTDANSLETMLIKYSGLENFEKLINKINWQLVKKYYLDTPRIQLAIEFSYKIGSLRKKNDELKLRLNFMETLESSNYYYDFLSYSTPVKLIEDEKYNYEISFDFEKYKNTLIDKSDVNDFAKVALKIVGNEDFSLNKTNWSEYCQGHDIIHFLVAMNKIHQEISNSNITITAPTHDSLNTKIIKAYKKDFFENSKISSWLKDKDNECEKFRETETEF